MAISEAPFAGTPSGDVNRIRRITFVVGSVKTVAHVDNRKSGSVEPYGKARDDSTEPANAHVVPRDRFIDEEA